MGYELRKARMTIDAEAIAKGLIEMMEEDGFVGPSIGGKPREVLKRERAE